MRDLPLAAYRAQIDLDAPWCPPRVEGWEALVPAVLSRLGGDTTGRLEDDLKQLRGLLAPLAPGHLSGSDLLQLEAIAAGVGATRESVDPLKLPNVGEAFPGTSCPAAESLAVWVGDITVLAADAIVNAANGYLLGCRLPFHPCIDNAIHSAAGPRLREDCDVIMRGQGAVEATGGAKITRGYALPARFVIHTVGPQLFSGSRPTAEHARLLAASYSACLNLAAEIPAIRTVAFCAISTGVFAFPRAEAAAIALDTVGAWMSDHGRFDRVVFNLFTVDDLAYYAARLSA